ncbi:MAG: hypothetical protein ABIC57_00910 [bacterium]
MNKLTCERREYLKNLGVDPDVYCNNCTPNQISGWCSGVSKLTEDVVGLLQYQMSGLEKIVVAS